MPPRPAPRQPRATCPTSTSSASSWRLRPPWPRRGEGPAGARGGKTSSSLLRPLGSCDLQDRPPSGSMDTSMRWSPSLSAAPAEARFVRSRTSPPADRPQWGEVGPFLPQTALSGEGRSRQEVAPCDSAPPVDCPQWGALLSLGAHGGGGDELPNRRRHGQLEEATAGPLLSD